LGIGPKNKQTGDNTGVFIQFPPLDHTGDDSPGLHADEHAGVSVPDDDPAASVFSCLFLLSGDEDVLPELLA